MTEEEDKAIKRMTEIRDKNVHTFVNELTTVLNLIQKQQAEIEKKDKIINLMADFISKYHCFEISVFDIDNECKYEHNCRECIRQYFEKKVDCKRF